MSRYAVPHLALSMHQVERAHQSSCTHTSLQIPTPSHCLLDATHLAPDVNTLSAPATTPCTLQVWRTLRSTPQAAADLQAEELARCLDCVAGRTRRRHVSSSGMWQYSEEEGSDDEWYTDEGDSEGGGGGGEQQAEPWPQEVLQSAGEVLELLLAWPASGEDMFGVGGGMWCGATQGLGSPAARV